MRYTILVVEDTRDTRELIKATLELEGYRVLEAENGLDALDRARRDRPDAILMEMSLPFIDGYKATKQLRQEPGLTAVPIIACTAHNRWEWLSAKATSSRESFNENISSATYWSSILIG